MTTSDTTLVTGAAGFVGQALLNALDSVSPSRYVVGLDRVDRPAGSAPCDSWRVVDLSDGAAVKEVVAAVQPTRIFHLAGLARGADWDALYRANVSTTIALLEAVRDTASECIVIVPGSAAEYGPVPPARLPILEAEPLRPVSPYGVSKAWQTLAALSFAADGLDVRVARLFNMIAPSVPASFALGAFAAQLKRIAAGDQPPVLTTGPLDAVRDFLDVRDVAEGMIAVAEHGLSGEVYNVCSGDGVSMRECLRVLIDVSGLEVSVESASIGGAQSIDRSIGSRAKLEAVAGWIPRVALAESLAAMLSAP